MAERTEQAGALIDFDGGDRVNFSCNPETILDSDSTDYAVHSIPGMSGPKRQFSCGGTRAISFVLRLHYGMEDNVETAIKKMRAWLYPEYEDNKLKRGPHRILLSFGNNWLNEKWVMTNLDVLGRLFDADLKCIAAELSITMEEYVETSRGRAEVGN